MSEASFNLIRDALAGQTCWPHGEYPTAHATCPSCRGPLLVSDWDDHTTVECRNCDEAAIYRTLRLDPEYELPALELADADWLKGQPMDIRAHVPLRLPTISGYPFACRGQSAIIPGQTGGGKSSLAQACAYDGGVAGIRTAYIGHEVTPDEFNARAKRLATLRGHADHDEIVDALRRNVRYLALAETIRRGDGASSRWAQDMAQEYDVVIVDPLSAVASTLGLDFDRNPDYTRFYDRLVQPLITGGLLVLLLDNVGHGSESQQRPKGASAKVDKADIWLSCSGHRDGLMITAKKVRSIRVPFGKDDQWLFRRETQTTGRLRTVEPAAADQVAPRVLELVSQYIAAHPGSKTSEIKRGVHANAQDVTYAIKQLDGSHIRVELDGKAHRHFPVRAYTNDPSPTADDSATILTTDPASEAADDSATDSNDSRIAARLGIDSQPVLTPPSDLVESERFSQSPSFRDGNEESFVSTPDGYGKNTNGQDVPF